MGTVGIPVKLLHEAVGHIITIELKGGASYRGRLFDGMYFGRAHAAEDNFNITMKEITVTGRDGKQSHLDSVYVRGNMIRFMVVPDMLQQAPMFKRVGPNAMKGRGIGAARGRATIMRGMYPLLLTHQHKPGAVAHPPAHRRFAGDQNVDSNMKKIPSYASTVMASPDSSVLASFCRFRTRSISATLRICETSFSVRASRVRTEIGRAHV